jgi:hypothetical protein
MTLASLHQENRPKPNSETWAVRALALLIALSALVIFLFADRLVGIDELGLYNPIYMYLHYDKMTYPIYYQFDYMAIHPPVHYLEVAWLMKLGLDLYYAEAIPIFTMSLIILYLIYRGRFSTSVKLGLMFGFFSAAMFLLPRWEFLYCVRPDLHLALAWFAGLVALENGRLDDWNIKKLFLGSFLLTYASGLHYFGAIAFTGVLVYVLWVYRALGLARAKKKILALIAGGCLFGLPYLIYFVFPYWDDIRYITTAVQGDGGLAEALARHFAAYDHWAQQLAGILSARPITILLWPILWLRIPAVCVSTLLLLLWPATRGIALAGLPLPLFVLLYSQGKSEGHIINNPGYYVPEFMLYLSSVAMIAIALFARSGRKVLPNHYRWLIMPTAATVLGIGVLSILSGNHLLPPEAEFSLKPRVHEMSIARAAAREIIGPNALVGGRPGAWYTAGATHRRDIGDLLWGDISNVYATAYFSWFDAIAEYAHMSDFTLNQCHMSLPSWYANGTLDLIGFYFAQGHPSLPYLLLNVQRAEQVVGYGRRDGQLYRFEEHPDGDYTFVSMVCFLNSGYSLPSSYIFFNQLLLPKTDGTDSRTAVITLVIPRDEYQAWRPAMAPECRIRDEIAGRMALVDVDALLTKLAREDQTIQFHRTFEEALLQAKNVVVTDEKAAELGNVPPRSVSISFDSGFYDAEGHDDHYWYWMGDDGQVSLESPWEHDAKVDVNFTGWSLARERTLQVLQDGELLAELIVPVEPAGFSLPDVTLEPGQNTFTFSAYPGAEVIDSVLHNGDSREVSIALSDVTLSRRRHAGLPPTAQLLEADFSGQARLLGYEISPKDGEITPHGRLYMSLYWQPLAEMDQDYTVFVHLADEAGRVYSQHDGRPAAGLYPTVVWKEGEVIEDGHWIEMPADIPAGRYSLRVGMYLLSTMERLQVSGGTVPADHVVVGSVEVLPDAKHWCYFLF